MNWWWELIIWTTRGSPITAPEIKHSNILTALSTYASVHTVSCSWSMTFGRLMTWRYLITFSWTSAKVEIWLKYPAIKHTYMNLKWGTANTSATAICPIHGFFKTTHQNEYSIGSSLVVLYKFKQQDHSSDFRNTEVICPLSALSSLFPYYFASFGSVKLICYHLMLF